MGGGNTRWLRGQPRDPCDDLLAAAAKDVPVRRVGQPEDVAAAVSFFCSEDASYVSGQVLYVAGGPRA